MPKTRRRAVKNKSVMKKKILFLIVLFPDLIWGQELNRQINPNIPNIDSIISNSLKHLDSVSIHIDKSVKHIDSVATSDKGVEKALSVACSCSPPPNKKYPFDNCTHCNPGNLLVYDFSCKSFNYFKDSTELGTPIKSLSDIPLKYDQLFQIKVINVNRYIYDVTLSVNDIAYASKTPALFNTLFLGDSSLISGLIGQYTSISSPTSTTQTTGGGVASQINPSQSKQLSHQDQAIKDFLDTLNQYRKLYYKMIDKQMEVFNLCPQRDLRCCQDKDNTPTFSRISEQYNNLFAKFQIADTILGNKIQSITMQQASAQVILNTYTSSLKDLYSKLDPKKDGKDIIEKIAKLRADSAKQAAVVSHFNDEKYPYQSKKGVL